MKQKIDFIDQRIIVEKFIGLFCDKMSYIPKQRTSKTWADMISKWCGCTISTDAINKVFEAEGVRSIEIVKGVKLFALDSSYKW